MQANQRLHCSLAESLNTDEYSSDQHHESIPIYNFDPLGFTGVCIIFLISDQKHRLWVLVRTASMRQF